MSRSKSQAQELPLYVQGSSPLEDSPEPKRAAFNGVGVLALLFGIAGLGVALVPGAISIGWGLIPIAFILGFAGVRRQGRRRGAAIGGITAAIAAAVAAVCVLAFVDTKVVHVSFGQSDDSAVEIEQVDGNSTGASTIGNEGGVSLLGKRGASRENPAGVGDVLNSGAWEFVVNDVILNADAQIAADSQFNDEPAEGMHYALTNLTATYRGDDAGWLGMIDVAFVTESGNVFRDIDARVNPPQPRFGGELYDGGTATGNVVLEIPEEAGVLRIEVGGDSFVRFVAP